MQVGKTVTEIPYKTDTSSEGNIMPLYISKKNIQRYAGGTAKGFQKSNIKLKMYNGTHITQLGTCMVIIKFKKSIMCFL